MGDGVLRIVAERADDSFTGRPSVAGSDPDYSALAPLQLAHALPARELPLPKRPRSEEFGMRAFWRDFGFTLSIFFVVVIAAVFAFVLSAPPQLVMALLVLGLFTAVAEHYLHTGSS
jgi:hypothetical protein